MFKLSIITPIFKKDETNLINNLKRIFINSNVAKIFQRIKTNMLGTFLENHNVINQFQYGFQRDKDIDQAIANVTQFIYKPLQQ